MLEIILDLFRSLFSLRQNYLLRAERLTPKIIHKIIEKKYKKTSISKENITLIEFKEFSAFLFVEADDSMITIYTKLDFNLQDRDYLSNKITQLEQKINLAHGKPMLPRIQINRDDNNIIVNYTFPIGAGITPNQILLILEKYHNDTLNMYFYFSSNSPQNQSPSSNTVVNT